MAFHSRAVLSCAPALIRCSRSGLAPSAAAAMASVCAACAPPRGGLSGGGLAGRRVAPVGNRSPVLPGSCRVGHSCQRSVRRAAAPRARRHLLLTGHGRSLGFGGVSHAAAGLSFPVCVIFLTEMSAEILCPFQLDCFCDEW